MNNRWMTMLSELQFTEARKEFSKLYDEVITLALDQLEIYMNEDSVAKAILSLISDMKTYAEDYINRLALFLNSPNRAGHSPYVLRILLCYYAMATKKSGIYWSFKCPIQGAMGVSFNSYNTPASSRN